MSKVTTGAIVAIVLVVVVGLAATLYYQNGINQSLGGTTTTSATTASSSSSLSTGGASSTNQASSQTSFSGGSPPPSPLLAGNSSTIYYPPQYGVLANFTLGLINNDRASNGLGPVTLSTVPSGQQHADSMDYYGYFSHWDTQGYKPYMRYTLLGGTGGVAENIAYGSCSNSSWTRSLPCTLQTIENSINDSEWQMMNNDSICCGNGHRENIVDPLHNMVSIGLAINSTSQVAYLVEDFEDNYLTSSSLQLSAGTVTFQGTTQQDLTGWTGGGSGAEITVYYDATPASIPTSELVPKSSCLQYSELNEPASCQYQGAYDEGTMVATVLAPCPTGFICVAGNFTYAKTWQQSSGNFQIVFSVAQLEAANGSGVYTFYLWPNGDDTSPITSLSVFVNGA